MAYPEDSATAAARPAARTVPVGSPDTRSFNYVIGVGVGTFALLAILFVVLDALNGHL